jgi:hypothetical protein
MMHARSRKGVTVLELVMVIVIIVVLALIIIPRLTSPALVGVTAPDSIVAGASSGDVAIRVTSKGGAPQRGAKVAFEATGVGSITPAEAETDSTGTAHATWHTSADSGTMTITAHLGGKTTPKVTMTSRVRAAATSNLTSPAPVSGASVESTKTTAAPTPASTPPTKKP